MKIKNIIIAEDVRRELGNKVSLMGILGSHLNIPESNKDGNLNLPFAGLVSLEIISQEKDPKDFLTSITIKIGKKKIVEMKATIEHSGKGNVLHLPVPRFGVPVAEAAQLSMRVVISKGGQIIDEMERNLEIVFSTESKN